MIFGCLFILSLFLLIFGFVRLWNSDKGGAMVVIGLVLFVFSMIFVAVFCSSNDFDGGTYETPNDPNYPSYKVSVSALKTYAEDGIASVNIEYLINNHYYKPEDFIDDYLLEKNTLLNYIKISKYFGNDLNKFWQVTLEVEPVDDTPLVITLIVLLISTVVVPIVWYNIYEGNISSDWIYSHDWFHLKKYNSFIHKNRSVYIKIKFKVFKDLFDAFSIAEKSPWTEMSATQLVLNTKSMPQVDTTNKYYQIIFSYFDYLRYLHFLKSREKFKDLATSLETANVMKKNTLDFCQDMKAMLKKEGRRPWEDLMK